MARKNTNTKQQTFRITAPGAMSVMLAGDFTHWQRQPMHKESGGVWQVDLQLTPGMYHYRFIVDGQWRDDQDCMLRVANPYDSQNAVRQVV